MKNLLLMALLVCGSARGMDIITASLTVTNAATNGQTISVNGVLRTWTNTVFVGNIQIQTTNTVTATATNLFYQYAQFPGVNFNLYVQSSSNVTWQSYPGFALTVTPSAGWAKVTYSTNTIGTQATVVRVPFILLGVYERTNVENGLVDLLNDGAMGTNIFSLTAPALARYRVDFAGLTNWVLGLSTNATNFALLIGANATNNAVIISNYFFTRLIGLDTAAFQPVSAFQPACDVLSNICVLGNSILAGLSYIEAPDNVLLKHTNGLEVLRANAGGATLLNFSDGGPAWDLANSAITLTDHDGHNRIYMTSSELDLLGTSGQNDLQVVSSSDVVRTMKPSVSNYGVLSSVNIGTVTNFMADVVNSGSSETHLNSYTFPANALTHDGDSFTRTIGIKTAANGNSKTVKLYFDSTALASGTTTTSGAFIYMTCTVTRDSSSTYRSMSTITTGSGSTGGTAGATFAFVNSVSGEDYTTTKECNVSCTGTSSSDLTVVLDRIEFKSSHDWAY
jgi:hypothetical protein